MIEQIDLYFDVDTTLGRGRTVFFVLEENNTNWRHRIVLFLCVQQEGVGFRCCRVFSLIIVRLSSLVAATGLLLVLLMEIRKGSCKRRLVLEVALFIFGLVQLSYSDIVMSRSNHS